MKAAFLDTAPCGLASEVLRVFTIRAAIFLMMEAVGLILRDYTAHDVRKLSASNGKTIVNN
jgi:hypothetical protein